MFFLRHSVYQRPTADSQRGDRIFFQLASRAAQTSADIRQEAKCAETYSRPTDSAVRLEMLHNCDRSTADIIYEPTWRTVWPRPMSELQMSLYWKFPWESHGNGYR